MGDNALFERVNAYIKEFLLFNNYQATLECLDGEERSSIHYQSQATAGL